MSKEQDKFVQLHEIYPTHSILAEQKSTAKPRSQGDTNQISVKFLLCFYSRTLTPNVSTADSVGLPDTSGAPPSLGTNTLPLVFWKMLSFSMSRASPWSEVVSVSGSFKVPQIQDATTDIWKDKQAKQILESLFWKHRLEGQRCIEASANAN